MQRQIGLSNSSNNHSFDNDNYPSAHLMANQTEINSKMRKILIDWIIDVHLKYSLLPETLFIAINLIDRYTERNIITRKKYQLVGVTCLMIAAKYEEIYPPQIDKFSYITDNAYKRIYSSPQILTKIFKVISIFQNTSTFWLRKDSLYNKTIC